MCIHGIKFVIYQYMYYLLGRGHNHMISKSLEVHEVQCILNMYLLAYL